MRILSQEFLPFILLALFIFLQEGSHRYYNSSYYNRAGGLYIEMEGELEYTVKTHKALSESHLTAGVSMISITLFHYYLNNIVVIFHHPEAS